MSNSPSALISQSSAFDDLIKEIEKDALPVSASGVTQNARPYLPKAIHDKTKRSVICVTPNEQTAQEYAASLNGSALFYPDPDLQLRSVDAKSRGGEMQRIRILKESDTPKLIFLSARAAMGKVIPKKVFEQSCIGLSTGMKIDIQQLASTLSANGYERTGTVYSKGEFAKRGEILDIFPSDSATGVRVAFFDDEIESIRHFDTETQKSVGKKLPGYIIPPAREVILNEEARQNMREYLKKQPADYAHTAEEILFELEEYGAFEIADTYLSVLYGDTALFDYFNNPLIVFDDYERVLEEAERIDDELGDIYRRLSKNGETTKAQRDSLIDIKKIAASNINKVIDMPGIKKSRLKPAFDAVFDLHFSAEFGGRMQALAASIKERAEHGYKIVLFAGAKAESLSATLAEFGVIAPVAQEAAQGITVSSDALPYGFESKKPKMLALGVNDIFGRVKKKIAGRKAKQKNDDIFSDLKPGDILVHEAHGKGRYIGLKMMETEGTLAEYMEIEYRGGDKLYIPTSQIDRIEKYIGDPDIEVQLSKLGGREWENTKSRVRESALKLAFDMVNLYSSRFDGEGYAFSPDTVWQRQFEDAFEYEETEGQIKSIEEIKRDMEAPRVMDRLLLGDVGYGKTEVAMRAAMKAVLDGKQVAVLVPTTLLARQHLETFKKRFDGFPVNIEGLTRFSKAGQKKILENLRVGKTDIIIGTHRLLSKDVEFNDLGLLIIDEEQRFGVNQKEKIKVMKNSVDVLTLTATPIPRTLEMSLTGIRDMSTIESPPAMRVESHGYVTRYRDSLLKDAVRREIARGGQVYFVCRKISDMDKLIGDITKNVPEARIAAAHGQMGEREMEEVISGFIDGQYDVLVCTTIIENGIDIPAVNTIIVYEADKFGLSQLYQLKGRVGRSDKSSYAYFTYNGEGILNETAAKRLSAIREFTQLGSGYKIAMRDLQIRGAGNLMGAEQSGHMASVGYSMYVKLMNEAVAIARGKRVKPSFNTSVELDIPAYIPDSYISDQADKMDIYKLISRVKGASDAKSIGAEIEDRYGKLPREVHNLLIAALIKYYAEAAGLGSVVKKNGRIELKYAENVQPDMKRILKAASADTNKIIVGAQSPLVLTYKIDAKYPTKGFLEFLASLRSKELKAA